MTTMVPIFSNGHVVWVEQGRGLGSAAETSAKIKKIEDLVANIPIAKPWVQLAQKTGTNLANLIGPAIDFIGQINGSKKDKEKMAQAGQINQLNASLRSQLIAVNQKTQQLAQGLQLSNEALKTIGFSGLGSVADDTLFAAKATNEDLQKTLDVRVAQLQELIKLSESAFNQITDLLSGKKNGEKIILFSIMVFLGIGIYAVYKLKHRE